MTAFTINLPQDLGTQIVAAGLLNQSTVTSIFQNALTQNRRSQLFSTIRTAQQVGDKLIPYAEIQTEIAAARRALHKYCLNLKMGITNSISRLDCWPN